MFTYITLHKLAAHAISDHPADPFNRKAELYQTWHLCELDPLIANEARQAANWARQGFSLRGAPDDGTSVGKGEVVTVVDPQISFGLPDSLLEKGTKRLYRFDTHYWESDGSATEKVRGAFSDATLRYLTKAWELAKEDQRKAEAALATWFRDNWKDIARGLIGAASPAALGVVTSFNLLPLLELVFDLARSNGDDYHQAHRFVIELEGTGADLKWRVIAPSGVHAWTTGPGCQKVAERVRDAGGDNIYDVEWRFRIID